MTNFYVTKKCNLRCRYCYPPGEEPELELPKAIALLEKMRPHNPALNITGGEPLLYKDISPLIRKASELGFYPLLLSTNGLLIERVVDDLHLIDHLVLSLDSISEEVNDELSGVEGATRKITNSIRRCASLSREKRFALNVHAVIAPETVEGMEDVLSFCESEGILLSVSPEHGRYLPNSRLHGNPKYIDLIERMLEWKRRGRPVFSSAGYLTKIKEFSGHRCYPFVSPRVEPDGRVYLPCQRIMERYVYLQDYENLCELMQKEARWMTYQECSRRCFLACYLEVERYLTNPLSVLTELPLKRIVFGRG
jgi:MoaA/NifB/PqqE/SkfB family radical SAM enzyme